MKNQENGEPVIEKEIESICYENVGVRLEISLPKGGQTSKMRGSEDRAPTSNFKGLAKIDDLKFAIQKFKCLKQTIWFPFCKSSNHQIQII